MPPNFEISYERQFWDLNYLHIFRLEQAGWQIVQEYPWRSIPHFSRRPDDTLKIVATDPNYAVGEQPYTVALHKKSNSTGMHTLFMALYGPFPSTFYLRDNELQKEQPLEGVVWADWDRRDRLVYAKDGKIFTAEPGATGLTHATELADFNSAKPKRTKSPQWAREW